MRPQVWDLKQRYSQARQPGCKLSPGVAFSFVSEMPGSVLACRAASLGCSTCVTATFLQPELTQKNMQCQRPPYSAAGCQKVASYDSGRALPAARAAELYSLADS